MPLVEAGYQRSIEELSPAQKLARVHSLLAWARDLYARELRAQLGDISFERMRWEVALRFYGSDPQARALIERKLRDVQS